MVRSPLLLQAAFGALAALSDEFDLAARQHTGFAAAARAYQERWKTPPSEGQARQFAEDTATHLTAAALITAANPCADSYIAARITQKYLVAGAAPVDVDLLLSRAQTPLSD